MRVCQITPSLEEKNGGPTKSVHALAHALATLGHDVELLATHASVPESKTDGRLAVKIFRRDWPALVCPSAALRANLLTSSSDVVHHHSLWLRTLHYARRAAQDHDVPLVISPRGMLSPWALHHNGWKKRLARGFIHPRAFASAAGWHVTSEEEAADVSALGFTQPICVAPNAVTPPTAEDTTAAVAHWRAQCPDVVHRPTAVFYSRFHLKKRVLELIDLWLAHAPADWLLLMVGIPQDYTPRELDRYVMRASGAGRVRAFDGVGQPPPYAVASLFLLPSHNENFGLVIGEAMAHGMPVLVTDTTPWTAVNKLEAGWCVPWADYARTLKIALQEGPARLAERGQRARQWVLSEFSWEKSARHLAEFYKQLKSARPSARQGPAP